MAVDVCQHFKSLPIKFWHFDKEIEDRRFTEESDYLVPPTAGRRILCSGDQLLGGTWPIRRTTERGVNDCLGINPGFLVDNRLDAQF